MKNLDTYLKTIEAVFNLLTSDFKTNSAGDGSKVDTIIKALNKNPEVVELCLSLETEDGKEYSLKTVITLQSISRGKNGI